VPEANAFSQLALMTAHPNGFNHPLLILNIPGQMEEAFRSKWNGHSDRAGMIIPATLECSFRCKWMADKVVAFSFS
jgi:hypothetical protein